jgi:general secretion pathway protein E
MSRSATKSTTAAAQAPAVRLLDRLLHGAAAAGASDLHLEPAGGGGLRVRMRVDGVLEELEPPPLPLTAALLGRLRLLAGVDLAERRRPQDGRLCLESAAGRLDIRASFVPVVGGEKAVLRLLAPHRGVATLEELGLATADYHSLQATLARPDGLLVVAGPTGAGKTTTLYAALERLRRPETAIATVEDPVELELDGIAQVAVDEEAGRGFAEVLRALLRQDPDVLLVGEVRDTDSARIACRAALTGHLVLTSVHASDAAEAWLRLEEIGIPAHLLQATLRLVVAQRLLRRLCRHCRRPRAWTSTERELFAAHRVAPSDQGHEAAGCSGCRGSGYQGRIGVFELARHRPNQGQALLAAGLRRAADGTTSVAEVLARCPGREPTR